MSEQAPIYPEFRKDRADEIIAMIESNPSCWNQDSWHCGTTHCFGGWAQINSGRPANDATVRRDARLWLGITAYEADRLFAALNSLGDIKSVLFDIADAACHGRDRDGYDRHGYDRHGYAGRDRDGYDRDGYDRDGYDRHGYDRHGYDRAGYDRAGYDHDGRDRDGLLPGNLE